MGYDISLEAIKIFERWENKHKDNLAEAYVDLCCRVKWLKKKHSPK